MALSEHTLSAGGRVVHYWEDGKDNGQSLILLHGAYGNAWANWSGVVDMLADEYRVLAPDLPGYGQSAPLPGMRIKGLVQWLRAFLDAANVEQAVVVGCSFGALVGRIFTAEYPKYVPALALVNGGVIPSIPTSGRVLARIPGVGSLLFNQLSKSSLSRGTLELGVKTEGALTDAFVTNARAQRKPLARLMRGLTLSPTPKNSTPRVPVLLLWGEEDAITPRVVAEHMLKEIPGAQLSLIANVGHLPHLEVPEVFAGQIKQFLREISRPRRPV